MSDSGLHGYGTTLSGATTGEIAEITNISIGGMEVDDLDLTTMDATNKWRIFKAGLKNAGELTLEVLYEKTNMATMLAALGAANEDWTITLPDGSTFVCSGYLRSIGAEVPVEDRISQSIVLKLSGEPTFTPNP